MKLNKIKTITLSALIALIFSVNSVSGQNADKPSLWEKAMVYGAASYGYYKDFTKGLYTLMHESSHAAAMVATDVGIEEFSPVPPVMTYEYVGGKKEMSESKKDDYKRRATFFNIVNSAGMATGTGGIYGYVIPTKDIWKTSALEKIAISLAPYMVDMALQATFKDKIRDDMLDGDRSGFYEKMYINQVSAPLGGALLSVIGHGDMANLADAILPKQDYKEWYYTVARALIGMGTGAAITYLEIKIVDKK